MTDTRNIAINRLLMRIARRAEKSSAEYLARTFVPVEPLPVLLDTPDNVVLYGRRGTGKTHLLKYLAELRKEDGDLSIYVDLRTVGSSGGLYGDRNEPLPLRATHLLVDVVEEIHNQLYELLLSSNDFDAILNKVVSSLDAVAEAATEVVVVGQVERSVMSERAQEEANSLEGSLSLSGSPRVSGKGGRRTSRAAKLSGSIRETGTEVAAVKFGPLGRALAALLESLNGRGLLLLFDEWSSIPRELQPYLADLLRRSFFPVPGISVKIGALERQSDFRRILPAGDYLGIDLGADTSASLDLDDFLVFRGDRSHAETFFGQLLYQHVSFLIEETGRRFSIEDAADFTKVAFSSPGFSQLVRAAEGVPRDALNIAGLAAALAGKDAISAKNVHMASREYFLRDKEGKISPDAAHLLAEIVQRCVDTNSRQLVLRRPTESDDPLVQALYDNRLIHRIQQAVTLHDDYLAKYDLYLVDFGCFVDILLRGGGRAVSDGTDKMQLVKEDSPHNALGLRGGSVVTLPQTKYTRPGAS